MGEKLVQNATSLFGPKKRKILFHKMTKQLCSEIFTFGIVLPHHEYHMNHIMNTIKEKFLNIHGRYIPTAD